MPRYLIHIGPHKTGSSYLQSAFQALRPHLHSRGVWYPEQWQGEDRLGHHRLAQRLRAGWDDGLVEEFAALNSSNHETILLSAEDLSDLKAEEVATLKGLMGASPVRIVFYCRRWSEVIPSGWQELVKHGNRSTFLEFLSSHLANPNGAHVINYSRTLRRYAESFRLSEMSLVSYSNIVDGGGDIFANFCASFLSWMDPPNPDLARVNVSLDPAQVEVIRALNAIEWARSGRDGSDILRSYLRNRAAFDLSALESVMRQHIVHAKVNEGTGPLNNLHAELFKEFGPLLSEPRSGARFFVPKLAEIPYVCRDYLLCDGVAASLQDIHRKITGQM
jgi:hypothetical protein